MVCSVTSTEWNWRNAALCFLRKNIHLNLCIIGGHHGILCEEERERNPTAQMCEFPYFTPPGARVPVWAPCKVPKRRGFKKNHRVSTAPVFQPKLFLYRINPVGGARATASGNGAQPPKAAKPAANQAKLFTFKTFLALF